MLATLIGLALFCLPANASGMPQAPRLTFQATYLQTSFEVLRAMPAVHRKPAEPKPIHRSHHNRRAWFEDDVEKLSRDQKPALSGQIVKGLQPLNFVPCNELGSAKLNCAPHVPLIYTFCTLLI